MVRSGGVRSGTERCGWEWQVRSRAVGRGDDWSGLAGEERYGSERYTWTRQGRAGMAWRGKYWRGVAWSGEVSSNMCKHISSGGS